MNDEEVGHINIQFPGCCDNFICSKHQWKFDFPADADAESRATIIGAAILLVFGKKFWFLENFWILK